jgi:hypothetical protein
MSLFGRAGRALLSPYEGMHSGTGIREVLAAYAVGGFALDPSFKDRPDHISAELAFLGGLARRETHALRSGDRPGARSAANDAREFFLRHVWPWAPFLFESMACADDFPLHRVLGEKAAHFLSGEGARLGAPRSRPRVCEASRAEPRCTACGAPLGVSLPEKSNLQPPWGSVCLRCRLREDLRRLES